MTLERLINSTKNWLDDFADYDDVHWEGGEKRDFRELVEEQRLVLELAEKSKKYKWHKRPENGWTKETLPAECEFIIFEGAKFICMGEMRKDKRFYSDNDEYDWGYENKYIECWRYYEPSEEGEQE